jgi:asparagine synthetase A
MGTRSSIGVMQGNQIKAVYCHWDGYLEYNGRILLEHYNNEKANELVELGAISSLGARLHPTEGSGHNFDTPEKGVTVFYKRDRGEAANFELFNSLSEWARSADAEYLYVMKDGIWYVSMNGRVLSVLAEALAKEDGIPI